MEPKQPNCHNFGQAITRLLKNQHSSQAIQSLLKNLGITQKYPHQAPTHAYLPLLSSNFHGVTSNDADQINHPAIVRSFHAVLISPQALWVDTELKKYFSCQVIVKKFSSQEHVLIGAWVEPKFKKQSQCDTKLQPFSLPFAKQTEDVFALSGDMLSQMSIFRSLPQSLGDDSCDIKYELTKQWIIDSIKGLQSKVRHYAQKDQNLEKLCKFNKISQNLQIFWNLRNQIDTKALINALHSKLRKLQILNKNFIEFYKSVPEAKSVLSNLIDALSSELNKIPSISQNLKPIQAILQNQLLEFCSKTQESASKLAKRITEFQQSLNKNAFWEIVGQQAKNILDSLNSTLSDAKLIELVQKALEKPLTNHCTDIMTTIKSFNTLGGIFIERSIWQGAKNSILSQNLKDIQIVKVRQTVRVFLFKVNDARDKLQKNPKLSQLLDEFLAAGRYFENVVLKIAEIFAENNQIIQLTKQNWEQIENKTGLKLLNSNGETSLGTLSLAKLHLYQDQCKKIIKEVSEKNKYNDRIKKFFEQIASIELEFYEGQNILQIRNLDQVQGVVKQMIQFMKQQNQGGDLKKRINVFNSSLDKLIFSQGMLIFINKNQLQNSPRFSEFINQVELKSVVEKVNELVRNVLVHDNKLIEILSSQFQELSDMHEILDLYQSKIGQILAKARKTFPRLFFLSNDEVIGILHNVRSFEDISKLHNDLEKMFENISKLILTPNKQGILYFVSKEGQMLPAAYNNVYNSEEFIVQEFLSKLEELMFQSVKKAIKHAISDYAQSSRTTWLRKHTQQAILVANQYQRTQQVQQIIKAEGDVQTKLKEYSQTIMKDIEQIVKILKYEEGLDKMTEKTIFNLIIFEVHNKDLIQNIAESSPQEFEWKWLVFLRHYWQNDDLVIKGGYTTFQYGYQYYGKKDQLVITPLTDRCYLSILQSIQLNLCHKATGPAGTGKTETTKDLAKVLGKQCIVFTSSDQVDIVMIQKVLQGVAQTGSWICFDEFNRIHIDVASSVSLVIKDFLQARASPASKSNKWGTINQEIVVKKGAHINITMNPGYAGRTQLPPTFDKHFLGTSMMVPDYSLISEIQLYKSGFLLASELAKKLVTSFKLASEQLSQQDFYDFGMRAVQSVIRTAQKMIKVNKGADQRVILKQAIKDVNFSKQTKEDRKIFQWILDDLFPGISELKRQHKIDFSQKVLTSLNLKFDQDEYENAVNLYETLRQRHGVGIVGTSGTGKTTIIKSLASSLTQNGQKIQLHRINPKSMPQCELYGHYQEGKWIDGVVSSILRSCMNEKQDGVSQWILFDGPIDAIWVEEMNMVLDDNKRLITQKGEVLLLQENTRVIFEVEDFAVASPATVSRLGMVNVHQPSRANQQGENLRHLAIVHSWIDTNFKQNRDFIPKLLMLVQNVVFKVLTFVESDQCKKYLASTPYSHLLQSFLDVLGSIHLNSPNNFGKQIENHVVFAMALSFGSAIQYQEHIKFNEILHELIKGMKNVSLPKDESIFNYSFINSEWKLWKQSAIFSSSLNSMLIHTKSTIRSHYLIGLHLSNNRSVLNIGPSSCKSCNTLNFLKTEGYNYRRILALPNTSSTTIKENLNNQKKTILFVEDVHLIQRQVYGAMPALEKLKELVISSSQLKRRGYVNSEELSIGVIASAKHSKTLSRRILRHFAVVGQEYQISEQKYIFQQKLMTSLQGVEQTLINQLSTAQLNVNDKINHEFQEKSVLKLQYSSSVHDLIRVADGMECFNKILSFQKKNSLLRMWHHQNLRNYGDRFESQEDIEKLNAIVNNEIGTNFNSNEMLLASYLTNQQAILVNNKDQKNYLYETVNNQLRNYTQDLKEHALLLCRGTVEYSLKMCKILNSKAQQHLLLVGPAGTGKVETLKLAAYFMGFEVVYLKDVISKVTSVIKPSILKAGLENKKILIILVNPSKQTLHQVTDIISCPNLDKLFDQKQINIIKFQMQLKEFMQNVCQNIKFSIVFNSNDFNKTSAGNMQLQKYFSRIQFREFDSQTLYSLAYSQCQRVGGIDQSTLDQIIQVANKIVDVTLQEQSEQDIQNQKVTRIHAFKLIFTFTKVYKEKFEKTKRYQINRLTQILKLIANNAQDTKMVEQHIARLKNEEDKDQDTLVGDSILEAAEQIFLPNFSTQFSRVTLKKNWIKIIQEEHKFCLNRTSNIRFEQSTDIEQENTLVILDYIEKQIILRVDNQQLYQEIKKLQRNLLENGRSIQKTSKLLNIDIFNQSHERIISNLKKLEDFKAQRASLTQSMRKAKESSAWLVSTYQPIIEAIQCLIQHINILRKANPNIRELTNAKILEICKGIIQKSHNENGDMAKLKSDLTFRLFTQLSYYFSADERLVLAQIFTSAMDNVEVERSQRQAFYSRPNYLGFRNFENLKQVTAFNGIEQVFSKNKESLTKILESQHPEDEPLPEQLQNKLTWFQKMILLKEIRPDSLESVFQKYAVSHLGKQYLEPMAMDYSLFKDIPNEIVVINGDFEQQMIINQLAKLNKTQTVTMGQGMIQRALKTIKQSRRNGTWTIISSCPYGITETLQSRIIQLQKEEEEKAAPHKNFKIFILMHKVKGKYFKNLNNVKTITYNEEEKLSNRLHITKQLEKPSNAQDQKMFNKMVPLTLLFFADVISRAKYGNAGFNIRYQFHPEDLNKIFRHLKYAIETFHQSERLYSLRYYFGELILGGRISDDKDRLTMVNITKKYFSANAKLPKSLQKYESKSDANSLNQMIKDIQKMGTVELCGLHSSAEINYKNQRTDFLISLKSQFCNERKSEINARVLKKIQKIESVIRKDLLFDIDQISKKFPILYNEGKNFSLNAQAKRYNRLINNVLNETKSLKLSIETGNYPRHHEQIIQALKSNKVPAHFHRFYLVSQYSNLNSWLECIENNIKFFKSWIESGKSPHFYDLQNFTFPQGFLSSILQTFSRKYIEPIHTLTFDFEVMGEEQNVKVEDDDDALYVKDLIIEGAQWNPKEKSLEDIKSKSLYSKLPVIKFKPTHSVSMENKLLYPLYKNIDKKGTLSTTGHSTNFIMRLSLQTKNIKADVQQLKGIALFSHKY